LRIGWIVVVALTGSSAAGLADDGLPDHELSRMPVRDRPHPGYEPIGYRLGDLFFYPRLLTTARYDTNVYASEVNPQADWAAVLSPQLTIKYGRGTPGAQFSPSRISHRLDLDADIYRFRELTSENRVDARARLASNWSIAQELQLDTVFEAARKHVDRGDTSSPLTAATPVPYNDLRGEATLTRTIGRFGVALNAGIRNLTYENVESLSGATLDLGGRDGTIASTWLKPFFEFSPGYRAFVRLKGNWRDYAASGIDNRNSDGYEVRGGVDFVVTPLISGSIEAGYMSQTYENPLIRPVDGPSFKGELVWLATALVTVKAGAERSIAETLTPGFGPRLDTAFSGQVDYELLRNVVVFGSGSFKTEDFQDTPRNDDVTRLSAGFDYALNRHLKLGARYDFISRESSIPIYSFDKHVVMFNVTAQH
jgi:hypothetical protein